MWSKEKDKEYKKHGSKGKVENRKSMTPKEKFFKFPKQRGKKSD
jgi:hypothetical protein